MLAAQTTRRAASLLVCGAFIFVSLNSQRLFAQTQAPVRSQSPKAILADTKRAQTAIERGDKAAAEGRVDDALAAYDEAARFAPQEAAVLGRGAALRAKIVREHADKAESLALGGNIPEATSELRLALRVDPTNAVVAERIAQLEAMKDDASPSRTQSIEGLAQLHTQKGKHNLDLRGDTKSAYDQVAQTFGIKVAFDPDLTARSVKLRVDGVDFATAMTLLAEQTGTFWRPISASLIFVTPDTAEKRRQYAVQAEQTFPLASAVAPEEMTELLRVLREITGSTHIELDSHTRAITMRDTPERLALASELVSQVERARGELMLEVELLEVDRDKSRKLGIPGQSQRHRRIVQGIRRRQCIDDPGSAFERQGAQQHSGIYSVRRRQFHVSADPAERGRQFFRCAHLGAQRQAGSVARARRQAGHILRR
jgi:tetratricopeptide (TPR) repeat protein